jgi:hypothetical protein
MIKLKVKEYCHECPDFEAKVTVQDNELRTLNDDTPTRIVNTTVTCSHAKRCEGIKRYLERAGKDVKPIV